MEQIASGIGIGLAVDTVSFLVRWAISKKIRKAGFEDARNQKIPSKEDILARGSSRQFLERTIPRTIGYGSLALGLIELFKGNVESASLLLTVALPHLGQVGFKLKAG